MDTQVIKKEPLFEMEAKDWNGEGESEKVFIDDIKRMEIGETVSVSSGNVIRNCVTHDKIKKVYEDEKGCAILSTIEGINDDKGEFKDNTLVWVEY